MAYQSGRHYGICDLCGFRYYGDQLHKTWDNLMACPTCYDGPRNPQDYLVRPHADKQTVRNPRPDPSVEPTVLKTDAVSSIADTTAVSGGNITNDGGRSVTEYGVCWSTSPAPDTDDNRTSDGTGTGTFTSNLTGLSASTRYYVRAYATNPIGTSYGPTVEFTTTA